MNTHGRTCPYCRNTGVLLCTEVESTHFLRCDNCGARGPNTACASIPSFLPQSLDDSLLRTVIDESPDIILMKNWEGAFLLCNHALARLYNTTPEQMVGKSDLDFNPDTEQVRFYKENIQAVMRSGVTQIVEEESTDAVTGEVRYFQSIKKPLKGPDGSDRILVIAHDVTELKRAYQVIEEKEKRYAYAMEAAGEGIWDWNLVTNQVDHNSKWCQLLGLDEELARHDMSALDRLIHPDDRNSMMAALQQALEGNGEYTHEHRMLYAGEREIWVYDRGRVVEYSSTGEPVRMVGSISDITARKVVEQRLAETNRIIEESNERLEHEVNERTAALAKLNRELKKLARHDALTGVGNRLLMEEWVAGLSCNHQMAVIMLDVDHFKQVNDRYGHKVGDKVLQQVAQCLVSHVRLDDLVVRFGGEEFLLALRGVTREKALDIAEALREQVAALCPLPSGGKVTISLGLALIKSADFDAAVAKADAALYEAKRNGRNRVIASTCY